METTLANIAAELEQAQAAYTAAKGDDTKRRAAMADIRRLREAEDKPTREEAERAARPEPTRGPTPEPMPEATPKRKPWEPTEEQSQEALEKLGYVEADARAWIIRPYLLSEGLTQIVSPPLPAVSDFIANLAAKFDGEVVLCAKSPADFTDRFVAAGGDQSKLRAFSKLDFTDDAAVCLRRALFNGKKVPRLFVLPNLIEFVEKPSVQTYCEKVIAELREVVHEQDALIFGWPSSQRKSATGCVTWTNAGDVNLTIADIRPKTLQPTLTPRERALWFIGGALASGPRPLKELLTGAREFGLKERTFYEAAKDIVQSTRAADKFGAATWELRRDRINVMYCSDSSHS